MNLCGVSDSARRLFLAGVMAHLVRNGTSDRVPSMSLYSVFLQGQLSGSDDDGRVDIPGRNPESPVDPGSRRLLPCMFMAVLCCVRLAASSHICPCLKPQSIDGGPFVRRGPKAAGMKAILHGAEGASTEGRAPRVNEKERPRAKGTRVQSVGHASGPRACPEGNCLARYATA